MTNQTERPILTRLAFMVLWIFVFTIPMTYATEIPLIGTISTVSGVAAMIMAAIAVVARRQVRVLGTAHMAMAGYIVWSAITLCWSVAPDLTIHRITTYIQLLVLVLLVWEMCVDERDILRMLSAFVLGTIIPALSTLQGFLPAQQTLIQRATFFSPDGAGYDANQLAFLLALSLPAAYFLILKENGPIVAFFRLQMGFAVCAILLSGSPSAMTAMVVGLSIVCWNFQPVSIRSCVNAFVIILLLAGGTLLLVPSGVWNEIGDRIRKGDVTLTSVIDTEVGRMQTTPIKGYGAGTQATPAAAVSYRLGGRPTVFTVLSETGPLGALCFLVMIGVLIAAAVRMSSVDRSFWLTALAVWGIGAFSLNWDCSQPAWLTFGLLAAHSACATTRKAAKAESPRASTIRFDGRAEVWS
jgi:hypothetical protein